MCILPLSPYVLDGYCRHGGIHSGGQIARSLFKLYRAFKWTGDMNLGRLYLTLVHDDVIKWKHFPRNWPFVRGIHRSPVNSPHKGQWRGALMFSLICVWISGWVNNREAGDFRRYCTHYGVIVMVCRFPIFLLSTICMPFLVKLIGGAGGVLLTW